MHNDMVQFADIGLTLLSGFFYILFAIIVGVPFSIGVVFPAYLIVQWRKKNPRFYGSKWYLFAYIFSFACGAVVTAYIMLILISFSSLSF